jgi:hypothetical protein
MDITVPYMHSRFRNVFRAAIALLAAFVVWLPESAAAQQAHDERPFNQIVQHDIAPDIAYLFDKLLAEKRDVTIDGVRAFDEKDKFLPGKIAIGLADFLVDMPRTDPNFARYVDAFRELADLTVNAENDTWGIYYYVSALNKLKRAGLLDRAVRPATLAQLREHLDWRRFVDQKDWSLTGGLPSNYYGVAFSIARLRYLLGWEDQSGSQRLLAQMVDHYKRYSGAFGFSDETQGEGRFDRYSVLLIGEICQRFIETDMPVTPQLKTWLRGSVNLLLPRLNPDANGFDYGRSIGAYGETAFLEVLSAAAYLDVLTPREKEMAYTFSSRVAGKYAHFWYDSSMKSVNLWDKGRRTDAYRGKFRILGENLSLTHQLMYTNREWNAMGYKDKPQSPRFDQWLATLPPVTLTWFAKGEYDRALLTIRDGSHVISLPMINGGQGQHANSPYLPIPFSHGMVAGVPDVSFPQLVPRITLADSTSLMPLAFFRGIAMTRDGRTTSIHWRQRELDRVGQSDAVKDDRIGVETRYTFAPGAITRTDSYTPRVPLRASSIVLEFGSFSGDAMVSGTRIAFARGDASELSVQGLESCSAEPIAESNAEYHTPEAAMKTLVRCTSGERALDKPFTIEWTLRYR